MKEKIEQVLRSIIVKYDEYRPWMNDPFVVEGDIYSTGKNTIIKAPKEYVGLFEDLEDKSAVKLIKGYFDFERKELLSISVKEVVNIIDEIPFIDECRISNTEGKCLWCDGQGEVDWEHKVYTKRMDCPVCDGDGVILESNKQKTGRKIRVEGFYIDFEHVRIKSCVAEGLVNIAKLIDEECIEVINISDLSIGFKIGGFEMIAASLVEKDQKVLHKFDLNIGVVH